MRLRTGCLASLLALLFLPLLSMGYPVFAASVEVRWEAVTLATGYEIETSTDVGITWTRAADVLASTACPVATTPMCRAPLTVADSGLTLIRYIAKNSAGRGVRSWSGAWTNESWRPMPAPASVGIQ